MLDWHGCVFVVGVDSVGSCLKVPLCLIEAIPPNSRMDPPLAEAEPISSGICASVFSNNNVFLEGERAIECHHCKKKPKTAAILFKKDEVKCVKLAR